MSGHPDGKCVFLSFFEFASLSSYNLFIGHLLFIGLLSTFELFLIIGDDLILFVKSLRDCTDIKVLLPHCFVSGEKVYVFHS